MTPSKHVVALAEDAEAALEGDAMPQTPELGKLGDAFDSREVFSDHMKRTAISLGFRLASRGSYPKKPRQDLCLACTVGRRKGKKGTTKDVVQDHLPCPVVVTGKLQLDETGSVKQDARFEITQVAIGHNHPLGFAAEEDEEGGEEGEGGEGGEAGAGGGKPAKKRKREETVSDDGASSVVTGPLRLPKIGDLFRTWDDFRQYARMAAESQGFTLGTAQSKGSSGTVVLRCSKFRDPNVPSTGSKPIEGGCEVMFKVTKSKKLADAFECVQVFEEHNHVCDFEPPKKKKKKADPPHEALRLGDVDNLPQAAAPAPYGFAPADGMYSTAHAHAAAAAAAVATSTPGAGSAPAPAPFLFDPYTGQRLAPPPPPSVPTAPSYFQPPVPLPPPHHHHPAPPRKELNVRFPAKAHTSITDFLSTLSAHLAPYGEHFLWLGVYSPLDMLDEIENGNEAEVVRFLDAVDTTGLGQGEGLLPEDADLVLRGLRKLRAVRDKMGSSAPL